MTWKLFLDDERFPVDDSTVVRTVDEAMSMIKAKGIPFSMSLDHDLGENQKTGYDFMKEFIDFLMDGDASNVSVSVYVHSQNPVGKKNIEEYWENFLRYSN